MSIAGVARIEEYQRYDGWFNNLANPDWGTVGSRLHRDSPSNYQDGVYMMDTTLPSARALSELVFKGPSGIPNQRNMTTMFAFFSTFLLFSEVFRPSGGLRDHAVNTDQLPVGDAEGASAEVRRCLRLWLRGQDGDPVHSSQVRQDDWTWVELAS